MASLVNRLRAKRRHTINENEGVNVKMNVKIAYNAPHLQPRVVLGERVNLQEYMNNEKLKTEGNTSSQDSCSQKSQETLQSFASCSQSSNISVVKKPAEQSKQVVKKKILIDSTNIEERKLNDENLTNDLKKPSNQIEDKPHNSKLETQDVLKNSLIEPNENGSKVICLPKEIAEAAIKAAADGESAINELPLRCPRDDYAMTLVNRSPEEKIFEMTDYLMEIVFNEQDREELEYNVYHNFIDRGCHPQLSEEVLTTLVDWLVELQETYELNHETLYLSWSLVYSYLSRTKNVLKQDIQLIASAALWVAAKYEERMAPSLENLIYLTDDAYMSSQFLSAEQDLLKSVDFSIYRPNAYVFLRRYSRILDGQDLDVQYMSRFILETSLYCHKAMIQRESKRAAASVWLARAVLGNPSANRNNPDRNLNCENQKKDIISRRAEIWPPTLVYCTRFPESSVRNLAIILHDNVIQMITSANESADSFSSRPCIKHTVYKYSNEVFRYVAAKYIRHANRNLKNL